MGEANHNPRSPQYRGPLPDFAIQPVLGYRLTPTAAWTEANKEALAAGDSPEIKPEDCDLQIVACAVMAYPSRLSPDPRTWPQAPEDVGVIATVPFANFKALIDAKLGRSTPTAVERAAPTTAS